MVWRVVRVIGCAGIIFGDLKPDNLLIEPQTK